jgi:hypothetical protein
LNISLTFLAFFYLRIERRCTGIGSFVNFTNHQSTSWSGEQLAEASKYGAIRDIDFPNIPAESDEKYIKKTAKHYLREIMHLEPSAVLCQGEFSLAFAVAQALMLKGVAVLTACSERMVQISIDSNGDAHKTQVFRFVKFRKYEKVG